MKLIYVTSKKFPSAKTDPFYVQSMAEAFTRLLGEDFLFLVRGKVPRELQHTNARSVMAPKRLRMLFYFVWLPILIIRYTWSSAHVVFLSYDPYLLAILIFWRKVFRFKYNVCSDWHQLFDDWKDRYVAQHSDYLTCTSKRLKSFLCSAAGADANKTRVVYGGVDLNLFTGVRKLDRSELKETLGLPKDAFLVGYVGGFVSVGQKKGLDTMIEALQHLPQEVTMVFVGGSEKHIAEYKALAQDMHVETRCVFVKRQPFENVVRYEAAMDVLTIPYPDTHHFRDYGFPMKVWEYMAAGRPLVYSDLAIMKEVLGERADSFKPGDAKDLARVVVALQHDVDTAERTARKNSADVEAYTWDARAKNIVNFIQK